MTRRLAVVVSALGAVLLSGPATPQVPSARTGSAYDLMDVDLMFVGAHPDDDGGVMATFARYLLDEGYTGTVITLTGGEGGGNAIGRQAGRSLGLIREEEERRSLAFAGVRHPHFLGLRDFYFTLSAEETEKRWGQSFVCDVVRHVRVERPEVMVTMWPGPGTHGQHQMAARAATLAFDRAGDPSFCPDQITREFLEPFVPRKLYYYPNDREAMGALAVPTSNFSRSAGMRYADLKALALSSYRSQGYDRNVRAPGETAAPESFLLVRSRVPVEEKETHLLAGTLRPADGSPPGVRLVVEPDRFEVGLGSDVEVRVRLGFPPGTPVERVSVSLRPPDGWSLVPQEPPAMATPVSADPRLFSEGLSFPFRIRAAASVSTEAPTRVEAEYRAVIAGREISGRNHAFVRAVPAVRASFRPRFDIAGYRDFARATHTEWVIPSLPARVPLVVGRATRVAVSVEGTASARGEIRLEAPAGVRQVAPSAFVIASAGRVEAVVEAVAEAAALPEGRHSARLPATLVSRVGDNESRDRAELYLLPSLTIPRVGKGPTIDGDLSDMQGFARGAIGPKDLWSRREPSGPEDSSAEFFLAYDAQNLYVGVHVRDESVVCNIEPDDVRSQLRSDAVGVTVDPSGKSPDTSTTFQAAAFPCTTAGFAARGFRDADAKQGLFEDTAPSARVASRRTADGYDIEFALPFAAMPVTPRPGDEIAVNVVLYDGDQKDARPGANINESGLAWAAFDLGGKQALPYLWPRVILGR